MSGEKACSLLPLDMGKRLCNAGAMKPTIADKPKQQRGFAVISMKRRREIAAMGGAKTARKYGRKHMSAIGKNGRRKRTLRERREKKLQMVA